GRIGYLRSLFPAARFIHLVREPLPQIKSTLKVDFWKRGGGHERLWWDKDIPAFLQNYLYSAQADGDPVALAAAQWHGVVEGIRREASMELDSGEYMEVRYEDFIAHPQATISELWQALGLASDEEGLHRIDHYPLRPSRNQALIDELSSEESGTIKDWLSR